MLRAQLGGIESRLIRELPADAISRAEFRVFSQFGEDGIVQFLIQRVAIENEIFIELGVEDYSEANTRFLLINNNWRGLIVDAGNAHVAGAREAGLDWQYGLDSVVAFIDCDNINQLIGEAGICGDIGLLSIDLDGIDYWVLKALEWVSPRILVAEYNSTWGPEASVTVPYDPGFRRHVAHESNLYWGASISALERCANEKGFALVGGNLAGNNAFFVRRDVLGDVPEQSASSAYRPSRFRESIGPAGRTYLSEHRARLELLADLPLFDVESGSTVSVRDRFNLVARPRR